IYDHQSHVPERPLGFSDTWRYGRPLGTKPFSAPGHVLLEPIALKKRPRPPVIPSKVVDRSKGATFSIHDIYEGPGLAGVPRGTVKKFRLFTYQFAYHGMGGQVNRVGLDGPWDIKRVLGTVPIEPDGSAMFLVPANTPISIQPLDEDGKEVNPNVW
ncbi:hypothetical protein LCGC14_3168900, partial [marine sediment metagenome]